jgi:hypothetical protein
MTLGGAFLAAVTRAIPGAWCAQVFGALDRRVTDLAVAPVAGS